MNWPFILVFVLALIIAGAHRYLNTLPIEKIESSNFLVKIIAHRRGMIIIVMLIMFLNYAFLRY